MTLTMRILGVKRSASRAAASITCFSDDAKILLGLEQHPQSLTHHVMIIGKDDGQSHVLSPMTA